MSTSATAHIPAIKVKALDVLMPAKISVFEASPVVLITSVFVKARHVLAIIVESRVGGGNKEMQKKVGFVRFSRCMDDRLENPLNIEVSKLDENCEVKIFWDFAKCAKEF